MKKFTLIQTLLLAVLTLIIGLFIGLFIDFPKTNTDDLSGTIGKVSKYHNVQVTEQDLLLRNELIEDTTLRNQYDRYLTYFYYWAIKTTSDLETVLKYTSDQEAFKDYIPVLKKNLDYLKTARIDIYGALQAISIIDSVQSLPMHVFLNDANNAIARMANNTKALMFYLDAIGSFLEENPTLATQELRDAHDILAINLMTNASVTNDKPTLRYLDNKKLSNDKEKVEELIADKSFHSNQLSSVLLYDSERLKDQLMGSGLVCDSEALRSELGIDIPIIVDQIVAGIIFVLNTAREGNTDVLRAGFTDQSPLQGIIFTDVQKLENFYLSGPFVL